MYYFIVNPSSCSGHRQRLWKELNAQIEKEGIVCRIAFTNKDGDAKNLARAASSKATAKHPVTVIVVGGDGTANEAVNGLILSKHLTFGYIPTGSGNDLARGLQLSCNAKDALTKLLHPSASSIRSIRIGRVSFEDGTSRRFLISCGIGYDAAVCHDVEHSRLKGLFNHFGLGKLIYLTTALRRLARLKGAPAVLTLDDGPAHFFDRIFFSAFMNMPFEGGGFMFCPDADPKDAFLDICLAEEMPIPRVLRILPTAFAGKHTKYKDVVHIYRCKKAVIQTETAMHVHTDGECLNLHKKLTLSLEETPLSFICSF